MSDATIDITDAWQEATDPENEFGQECTAVFSVEPSERRSLPSFAYDDPPDVIATLTGLVVDDGHGPQFHDRAQAVEQLGADAVSRIEDRKAEQLAEEGLYQ